MSLGNLGGGSTFKQLQITYMMYSYIPTPVFLGFPGGSAGKEFICNAGDLGSIPGLARSPVEGKGYPLHYSVLEKSMESMGSQKIRHD